MSDRGEGGRRRPREACGGLRFVGVSRRPPVEVPTGPRGDGGGRPTVFFVGRWSLAARSVSPWSRGRRRLGAGGETPGRGEVAMRPVLAGRSVGQKSWSVIGRLRGRVAGAGGGGWEEATAGRPRVLGPHPGGPGPGRGIPGRGGSLRFYSWSHYTPRVEKGPGGAGETGAPGDPDKWYGGPTGQCPA